MRKDEDDDWSFEPPPKSLRVERIRAKTRTSLREKREKRERKERERRESAEFSKKKRTKKDEKTLSAPSAFCRLPSREQNKGKRASAFPRSENCSLLNTTFYPLSVPTTNNTIPRHTKKQLHKND
tara:strand:- start:443 stop:817 length:375 start_codon:yes stop_codon:yes gene_type:complete